MKKVFQMINSNLNLPEEFVAPNQNKLKGMGMEWGILPMGPHFYISRQDYALAKAMIATDAGMGNFAVAMFASDFSDGLLTQVVSCHFPADL